jgi:hypothetical protein
MKATRRMTMLVGGVLALAACGTSAPAATTGSATPSAAASTAATSAKPASTPSPTPTPAIAARCDKSPMPFDPNKVDLTGAWAGDDGGIYYLRQLGTVLWWNGMSERGGTAARLGRDWNNVAKGTVDKLAVTVDWADVPRGEILGSGKMTWKVEDDGTGNVRVVKVTDVGSGFGNTVLTPCKPG